MKATELFIAIGLVLYVVSVLDIFPEPYHHQYQVNFWEWARREILEMIEGEKE